MTKQLGRNRPEVVRARLVRQVRPAKHTYTIQTLDEVEGLDFQLQLTLVSADGTCDSRFPSPISVAETAWTSAAAA